MHSRRGWLILALVVAGCGPRHAPTRSALTPVLGKIVVYRNGVAHCERRVHVDGGRLTLVVPPDRVDAVLASLTVADAAAARPLAVEFPRRRARGEQVELTTKLPPGVTDVVITYLTTGAWTPTYRAVAADDGTVDLRGSARVDNTSGEDWRDLIVEVASRDVMSRRYGRPDQPPVSTGDSSFASRAPMTVAGGASAVVATVHARAEGGEAYLYDLDGGSEVLRALWLRNPTEWTLEPGPVDLYRYDRFLGAGETAAVPPRGIALVPYARDRQVAVQRERAEDGAIRTTTITLTSQLRADTTVYVRRADAPGARLLDGSAPHEPAGDADLFTVALPSGATAVLTLREVLGPG